MIIKSDELHLWHTNDTLIEQSTDVLKEYRSIIDAQETDKANKFRFKYDQQLYLVAHGMLRIILSYYDKSVLPEQWKFKKNPFGKWSIASPNLLSLTFNLSHTRAGIVILVGCYHEVGVDIENVRTSKLSEETDLLSIAGGFFNEEEVKGLYAKKKEQRKEFFLRLWTLKESYIKAIGKGLSADLMSFSFTFPLSDKLKFTDHSNGSNNACQSWHYQSNQCSMVSITLLNPTFEKSPNQKIHIFDFSKINGGKDSNESFHLFAKT